MRKTVSISPVRKGKQQLLTSCAIAAGILALAYGGPARAQVMGTGDVVSGPNTTIGNAGSTTTVNTGIDSSAIINWTPSATPVDGVIEFLAVGNTLQFVGPTPGYTVLNRFVSGGAPISDQIALNGLVQANVGASTGPQGGNIWFYNSGGILVGSTGVINVGSLVLTANDIDTTGGLLGPGGEIRFRGDPGSTAAITINGTINAALPGNPGGSYVALVAPRIVQNGLIDVDGSAALVAAERADIRINSGLFDINVSVGAEGGDAIVHNGITTGPEQQPGATNQSRIYFVAIPKNDAVTMLVSGQVGYQDAVVAQTNSDGAIVLSAGYNIVEGAIDTAPVNGTAANITITDSIIRSDVTAHASGAFLGQPTTTVPSGPIVVAPPPHLGRLVVQGNATFIGDASATLNVGADQIVGATGDMTVQANGANGLPGEASVNVTGGVLVTVGGLSVTANGSPDAATGESQGGTASLSVTGGTVLAGGALSVAADGAGGFDDGGNGGNGNGGTATITVTNSGSTLTANDITVQANGSGGGLSLAPLGGSTVADVGGNGQGGNATIAVTNGAALTANNVLAVDANGAGQVGTSQSGNGTGGTAQIEISGTDTSVSAGQTLITANGAGGGSISIPLIGTFASLAGGDGQGGTANLILSTDTSSSIALDDLTMTASAVGGGGNGADARGGSASGGDIGITASNGTSVEVNSLTLNASALSGGADDPVGANATSGDATGGTVVVNAVGGGTFEVDSSAFIDASAVAAVASHVGSSTGGDVVVSASGGGTVGILDDLVIVASAGQFSSSPFATAGTSVGGNVDLTADGGTVSAGAFSIDASAATNNTNGTSGAARGGTIDILSSNGGLVTANASSSTSVILANAAAGISAGGTDATGGAIQLIADGGAINFSGGVSFSAGGIAGGDNAATASGIANGQGGTILVEVRPSSGDTSAISFADADIGANGNVGASGEGADIVDGSAAGVGGTVNISVQAGTFSGNDINVSASGFGGSFASTGSDGSGGNATFSQSGGNTSVNNLTVVADGVGGGGYSESAAGQGFGGNASVILSGGVIDATLITASASGIGGDGAQGDDFNPSDPTLPGDGGGAAGGTATITISAGATVNVQDMAANAGAFGGAGGDFFSVSGANADGGAGGNATGGNAGINLLGGNITVSNLTADSTGTAGRGGSLFGSSVTPAPATGGNGGIGQGGLSDILVATDTANVSGSITSLALGVGGIGGDNSTDGDGGAGIGGRASVQIDDINSALSEIFVDAGALGGDGGVPGSISGAGGNATGGDAIVVLAGGVIEVGDITAAAIAGGGSGLTGGIGQGGNATIHFQGGTINTSDVVAVAAGLGGLGTLGDDADPGNPTTAGSGGAGFGGNALIDLDGTATVDAAELNAAASGIGGSGGDYFASGGVVGDTGDGGSGTGGNATVRLVAGSLTVGSIAADALGSGGDGGDFFSATSGPPLVGTGMGGNGGDGQGGIASIEFFTAVDASSDVASLAVGEGGAGGNNSVGGIGGAGIGGTAQAVVEDIDAGTLGILLDASATGGNGGTGLDGVGGQGGLGAGGLALVDVRGPNGRATVSDANFEARGIGGTGGDAFLRSGGNAISGPTGGNGGDGVGGTIQVRVTDGEVELGIGRLGISGLSSNGLGGDGGRGADNFGSVTLPGPDGIPGTIDDVVVNFFGGNGGIAGAGTGGTVQLTAIGGTIGSNGGPVFLSANGQSGDGGDGGDGTGGSGGCCGSFLDQGGTVILEALNSPTNRGLISFGETTINADGFGAGRVELIAEGSIIMASLTATTLGAASQTNNDTDLATTGIFMGINDGGLIQTDGAVSLDTSGTNGNQGASVGVYAQGTGQLNVGGSLTVNAGDQVEIRHDFREGDAPTIQTGGSASFTANNSIRSAPGSLVSAGTSLSMTVNGTNSVIDVDSLDAQTSTFLIAQAGRINVYGTSTSGDDFFASANGEVAVNEATAGDDISLIGASIAAGTLTTTGTGLDSEVDGANIYFSTSGAATVEHAEADNDFTAIVGSFATGLNSIITGGDIDIASVGAVDLGNSDAGGSVRVNGTTIAFNDLFAGTTIDLAASGAVTSTGALSSGESTSITGSSIALSSATTGTDLLLTSTSGDIGGVGSFSAGHDLTIESAANVDVSELNAGDDITVDASGTATIGSAFTYASGPDNEGGGSNILVTSGGALTFNGIAISSTNTVLEGSSVSTQALDAGGNISITSTTGNIQSGGNVSGFNVTFDSAGDIDHAADSLLQADNVLSLTAVGNIATGAASAGDNLLFNAGGDIDTGALAAGFFGRLEAGGAISVSGDVNANVGFAAIGSEVSVGNITTPNGSVGLFASSGDITASGTINSNGDLNVVAAGAVSLTGNASAGNGATIEGASIALASLSGSFVDLVATSGGITSTGEISAFRDIFISTADGGNFNRLVAGDDIFLQGSGDVRVEFMNASGENPGGEEIGSNVEAILTGNLHVEHAEAADDFIANVQNFSTGLNSIITGGNIEITAAGTADLGNSVAGGHIDVNADAIDFVSLEAGDFVDLDATGTQSIAGAITGTTILAETEVFLAGDSITIASIEAGDSLSAVGLGGAVAITQADIGGNVGVFANGDVTGNYSAGGDISISSLADVTASANARGDYVTLDGPTAGNVFVTAAGDVDLQDSSAAGMFGVNAGGSASIVDASAGEDMLVIAGSTANLANITVGDDVDVRATGNVTANNVSATGNGPDGFMLSFDSSGGFTISQGEGSSSLDGADIDIRSADGSITAATLSAGDDIFLTAATTLTVSGATTLGIGLTGGDSSIVTQSGDATLAGLNAFDDVRVGSSGTVAIDGASRAGRDIVIAGASVDLASLTDGNLQLVETLVAGRNLSITSDEGISGGSVRSGGDMTLSAATTIDIVRAVTETGGAMSLVANDGIRAATLQSGGTTDLTSDDGAILVTDLLMSSGPVAANGNSIDIEGGGDLVFSALNADVGNAAVSVSGNLSISAGQVAGTASLYSTGDLGVTQLTTGNVEYFADDNATLGNVTASGTLVGDTREVLTINGVVTAQQISLGSGDIVIAQSGRIGTGGTTQTIDVRNIDPTRPTFVGGTGTRSGYHLDAAEMTRLFANDIAVFAPRIDDNQGGFVALAPGALPVPIASIGSGAQPDVVIDDFTITAGGTGSNLGATGSLTIETPGKARVVGNAALTGMSDSNSFTISADDALEVILGEGTIRLTGTGSAPGGVLNLQSEDVIVATASAISDVGSATTIGAINDRLAQNDGILLDEGALVAGGIDVGVSGGFYVQNSGSGTRFVERRGLTFGALGLNVDTEGPDTRIVINGVHLGPTGQVTGLDAIPLLTINGSAVGATGSTGSPAFNAGSTMNGCLIVSSATCFFQEFETSFPVQDVIEREQDGDDKDADGQSLPIPLITMRDLDPMTGEPLLDDPVTGAGNDDLWTPPGN